VYNLWRKYPRRLLGEDSEERLESSIFGRSTRSIIPH